MQLHKLLGLMGISAAALLAGAAACGGDDAASGGSGGSGTGSGTGTGTATGTASGTGSGTSGGTGTGTGMTCELTCEPPNPAHEEIIYTVGGNVTGEVLDQSGNAAESIVTDVCGTNICLYGSADANGQFNVDGGDTDIDDVRLLYGDGKRFAKMGARLPNCDAASCNGPAVGTINTINLPAFSEGAPMAPGMDASQGGATLSIPADACIKHDLLLYGEESERGFRATLIDYDTSNLVLPAVDQANLGGGVVLIATAPINTVVCPAAALSFDNIANWTDGAEVEIYFHGTRIYDHYAPYGEWTKIGEGTVSGTTVTTKDGDEIEMLGLFAAVLK